MTRELPNARLIESLLANWYENVTLAHTYSLHLRSESYQRFLSQQALLHQTLVETAESGLRGRAVRANPTPANRARANPARANIYSMDVGENLMRSLLEYWRREHGIGFGLIYDIYLSLCLQFLHQIEFEDEDTFYTLTTYPSGVIFVANHQTAVESSLFNVLFGALQRRPVVALSKAEHQHSWIGRFLQLVAQYPGANVPSPILYMDRKDPQTVLKTFHALARMVSVEQRAALVHVEGTRARRAGQPVESLSSALIDIACANDIPLVPVRFTGGLPVHPVDARLDYPIGFGAEDIRVGSLITADQLREMTSAKRKDFVLERLNRLIPNPDVPHPPKPMFERDVRHWQTSTLISGDKLGLIVALEHLENPSEETLSVLSALDSGACIAGDQPEQKWLRQTVDFFRTNIDSASEPRPSDFDGPREERWK